MPDIADFVPGGIQPTDRWHIVTNDGRCSRCSALVSDHELPLALWNGDGRHMLIYCERCLGGQIDLATTAQPKAAHR